MSHKYQFYDNIHENMKNFSIKSHQITELLLSDTIYCGIFMNRYTSLSFDKQMKKLQKCN